MKGDLIMAKVAVVFWSGTGNTGMMAKAVAEGATAAGAEAKVFGTQFTPADMDAYDAVAFGCPAMGDEVLEEDEFEPMFAALESKLAGKKIALFGSYGWGDGQWMRDWDERAKKAGANMPGDYVIACGAPSADGKEACEDLGKALA